MVVRSFIRSLVLIAGLGATGAMALSLGGCASRPGPALPTPSAPPALPTRSTPAAVPSDANPGTPPVDPAASPLTRFEFTRVSMGVPAKIRLYAKNREEATHAAAAAFDRIAQLDDRMSDYRPRSELMRLCENSREGPTPPLPVSADLFDIFATSREVAAASDGAFDITVGPLVQAWRHARREARLPTPEVLQDARARVGWESLLLDPSARTVSLQRADMRLDLGGIAKGYAAERAVRTLKDHGVPRCLVAMSGDIVVGDPPPGETGWRIELPAPVSEATACHGLPTSPSGGNITQPPNLAEPQAVPHSRTRRGTPNDPFRGFFSLEPFEPGASFVSAVRLANAAISTSGDSQQFIEIDGVRYSHIVDPRTGLGVTNRVLCTVIAPTGEVVDAVASAICVLGVDPNALTKLHAAFPTAVTIIWN